MWAVLSNRIYRQLFAAQIIALIGTGLLTVALGLLAYDLAGADAGVVLGTALAIKMLAYVSLAPIAAALAEIVPRRAMLIGLDLARAAVALALPFVTEIWQIYILIFLLQAASAGFTPTFQATIPDVLPDEADYTNALSLSRLAYDLESLISPMLAAALLTVVSFHALFAGTVIGFIGSAALVLSVRLPAAPVAASADAGAPRRRGFGDRMTRGVRLYLATPRLRGLLALNMVVAAAGAMVIVNTVVIVQAGPGLGLGLGQTQVALALAAFGAGSMLAALVLPGLLGRTTDRAVMLAGAVLLVGVMAAGGIGLRQTGAQGLIVLMLLWALAGVGYSVVQTPSGRLLRRSSHPEDRPAIFAAQFALSHGCWLITYPLVGWIGAVAGISVAFAAMALIAALAAGVALRVWPALCDGPIAHSHQNLPADHPHLQGFAQDHGHAHPVIIDPLHPVWPRGG